MISRTNPIRELLSRIAKGEILEKKTQQFIKVLPKIYKLGLSSLDRDVFIAIVSHSGPNSRGVFPSQKRLSEMTGISERQVRYCLDTLYFCNMIQWDKGKKGSANEYTIMPDGCWTAKVKYKKVRHTVPNSTAYSAVLVRHTVPPNQMSFNQNKLTRDETNSEIGDFAIGYLEKLKNQKGID